MEERSIKSTAKTQYELWSEQLEKQHEEWVQKMTRYKKEALKPMGKVRENEGFIIIASKRIEAFTEVVFGFNPETSQYVTWLCSHGKDYSWGHYGDDFSKASDDFKRRCRK